MSRSTARKVVEFFHHLDRLPSAGQPAPEVAKLTAREQEILASVARGHSYNEIASHLGISGDTTRKHMGHIPHVHSHTEALLKYLGR